MRNLLVLVPLIPALLAAQPFPGRRPEGKKGSPEALARREGRLKQGEMAADFSLKRPRSEEKVTLSQYRGKMPVALIFGSYT